MMPGKAEKTLPPIKGSGVREDRAPGQARPTSWSRWSWEWNGSPKLVGRQGLWVGTWFLVPLPERNCPRLHSSRHQPPRQRPVQVKVGGLQSRVMLWAPQ